MPRPSWDDEHKNMHPTCEASGALSGPEVAFLARIKFIDDLSKDDRIELLRLWRDVEGIT